MPRAFRHPYIAQGMLHPESGMLPTELPAYCVPRPHLLQRFSAAIGHPATIVSAPAGAGKSTLVATGCEVLRAQGWHIAWLSLEPGERDPALFWLHVMTAIERAVPGLAKVPLQSMQSFYPPPIEVTLTAMINALAERNTPLLLALDDYHLAAAPDIDAGLLFLIEHVPPAMRLIIVSRTEPEWPLGRLRVRGQLAEIREDSLRFSEAETGVLCGIGQ